MAGGRPQGVFFPSSCTGKQRSAFYGEACYSSAPECGERVAGDVQLRACRRREPLLNRGCGRAPCTTQNRARTVVEFAVRTARPG